MYMSRRGENIRKRNDGRWEARCLYKENGKSKYKSIYGKTYMEVKRAKENFLINQCNYKKTNGMNIHFCDLLDEWLEDMQYNIKESTYSRYEFLIHRHIVPQIGHLYICELSNEVLLDFTKNKLQSGRLNGEGGLSPKTVIGMLSIIKLSLKFGQDKGYSFNYDLSIQNPKQYKPNIQILSIEDQRKLESSLNEDPFCLGILLSLYAGLRIGEVCALKWGDIDLFNGNLQVRKTIIRISDVDKKGEKKTKIIMDSPKTACSIRKIPLPQFLISILLPYKKESEYFVVTGNHKYIEPRTYYRKYKHLTASCGLEHYNYHALRHTFATRCVESGFDLKSLSEILGHANVSTTLQRYVHPSMELKKTHMNKLANISVYGQN